MSCTTVRSRALVSVRTALHATEKEAKMIEGLLIVAALGLLAYLVSGPPSRGPDGYDDGY